MMDESQHSEPNARIRDRYLAATKDGGLQDGRETDAASAERRRKQDLLTTAMDRWQVIEEAEADQRRDELDDLRFDRGRTEDHWPQEQIEARKGGSVDGYGYTARPCLVVNKTAVPVQQVENEIGQARLEPNVKAKPGKGNDKDAEVRQGIIRHISTQSNAQSARMWAASRMVRCGRGYYGVDIDYANDGDFELDILIRRFKNQGAVYVDPFHTQPDGSDFTFAFITEDLPHDEAKRKYPDLSDVITSYAQSGTAFSSLTDAEKTWLTAKVCRVAEYWYVETVDAWLVEGHDQPFDSKDEAQAAAAAVMLPTSGRPPRMRAVQRRVVKWALLGPGTVLAEHDWPGRYIPIVQVIGREINVDGKTTYKGMIRDTKDANRIYDYGVSAQVEAVALLPRAPYIHAAGQIEKYKRIWAASNTKNFVSLPYDPQHVSGTLVPPPQRSNTSVDLSGANTLIVQADNDIKAITGRFDPSLGALNPQERSGRALRELKMQAELGSSHFTQGMAAAQRFEGVIILDLLKHVYTEPGRLAKMLGDEPGDEKLVMLNAPFIRDEQGMPQPAPGPARMAFMTGLAKLQGKPAPVVEEYDLTRGDFGIVVDVAPSYKTQREENIGILQSLIEADPNMTAAIADILAEEIGGPMGRKVSARLRTLNPKLQPAEGEGAFPPEAQSRINQLEMQLQELGAAMQQAQMALATDQAKQQAQVQVATIREQGALARIQAQFMLERERLAAEIDAQIQQLRAEHAGDARLAEFEAAMKKALQDDEQRHEVLMAGLKARIAADAAAVDDARAVRDEQRTDLRTAAQHTREDRHREEDTATEDRRREEDRETPPTVR